MQAPALFDGQPVTELVVPIYTHRQYERGASIAARYAMAWGIPVRLLHVRSADDPAGAMEEAVATIRGAHPEIDISGTEIDGDNVGAAIAGAAGDTSLVFLASDHSTQWLEQASVGEEVVQAAASLAVLCGPDCTDPPVGASVVVPLDGSPRAEAAIEVGRAVAAATGVKLWLVTVVSGATAETVAELRASGENVSESGYVRSVAETLAADGVDVGWEVVHDEDPVAGIAGFVADQGSTMAVAATHGDTGVARRLFGSVCMGLVEQGTVPVLVVKTDVQDSEALPRVQAGV
jgi:nucleotide-binding universal stress UspA family protein